jgi:hypothetical protein
MALVSGGANGYRNLAGVEFGMKDGGKIVRVLVSDEALDDLEPMTKRRTDYLGIFERHRAEIEQIAAESMPPVTSRVTVACSSRPLISPADDGLSHGWETPKAERLK